MHHVRTKLLVATAADETAAAIDMVMNGDLAILKARGRRKHQVERKLPFATTAANIQSNELCIGAGPWTLSIGK